MEVKEVSSQVTLEQLERQIAQLPLRERLKLIVRIAEGISSVPPDKLTVEEDVPLRQRERETQELLAMCDAAAEMWDGEFNAAEEIRQMRQERDEQTWLSRS